MARRASETYLEELQKRLAGLSPENVYFRFDEYSDTLFMNLTEEPQPAISVYINAGWLVRVHRDNDEVVGLQIDNALSESNPFSDLARDTLDMLRATEGGGPHIVRQTIDDFSEALPQLICCV